MSFPLEHTECIFGDKSAARTVGAFWRMKWRGAWGWCWRGFRLLALVELFAHTPADGPSGGGAPLVRNCGLAWGSGGDGSYFVLGFFRLVAAAGGCAPGWRRWRNDARGGEVSCQQLRPAGRWCGGRRRVWCC